ncbi:MAG: N-acylglucosamine 2-epimerase [Ruminococcaceae bacterium]|nr:N-acylglucosamine 2-epimerase [Oscillospiraceae bacterium]
MLHLHKGEKKVNFKKELTENILSFWMKDAIDYKNGGIYTQLDREGNVYGRDKSVWFQGRALWVFSKAYNVIEKNPEYLKIAENLYSFLPKCTDADGRMYFTVTEDGKGLQKRRYYYSETFAAIGCAEYYKATGDKGIMEDADKYFQVAYECFKGIRYNPPKINPQNSSMKSLAPVMIMLSTAQVMRSMNSDKKDFYDSICTECVEEIVCGGYLTDKGLMENVNSDGTFSDTPTGRIVNPGHSMEAAWFVMSEGIIKGDQRLIDFGKNIIDITYPLGWDQKNGGLIAFTDVLGCPPVQLEWDMKLWWPQCETMIAMRYAYMLFGDEKYLKIYEEVKEYCKKYFIDEKNGEWYGYLHYDNTPSTTLKGNIFKGPFHIPRLYILMSVLDETDDILQYLK